MTGKEGKSELSHQEASPYQEKWDSSQRGEREVQTNVRPAVQLI